MAGGSIAGAMLGAPVTSSAIEAEQDPGSPGRRGPHADLAVAADAIGISEDELRAALDDGQSMAEVAAANGVEAQAVIDALVADANARLDEAVAAGDIEEDRAAEIREGLVERITALVNGELPARGPGGPGGHHGRGPRLEAAAEAIGISEDDLRTALADGQTVAEVAAANGIDAQVVIDALVAEATERITAFVNGE